MVSGMYQSMVISLKTGSNAFFKDLISYKQQRTIGEQIQKKILVHMILKGKRHLVLTLGCSLSPSESSSTVPLVNLATLSSTLLCAFGPRPKPNTLQGNKSY